jgi:hypothetical protein
MSSGGRRRRRRRRRRSTMTVHCVVADAGSHSVVMPTVLYAFALRKIFYVALLLYPSTHAVGAEGLKRVLVFSLARTGNVARTHSVSAEGDGWEDFLAVFEKRKKRSALQGRRDICRRTAGATHTQTLGQPSGVCSPQVRPRLCPDKPRPANCNERALTAARPRRLQLLS